MAKAGLKYRRVLRLLWPRKSGPMTTLDYRLILTRRLIILTGAALLVFTSIFGLTLVRQERLMISWVVFICGIIGGFVSIQQRVKDIPDAELELLSRSWYQILLIPIFGAVFSLVLYCIFLSGLLTSNVFPTFHFPKRPDDGPDTLFMVSVLRETYPNGAQDLAKLILWSFVAGFAERFVPQIISNFAAKNGVGGGSGGGTTSGGSGGAGSGTR